MAGHLARNGHIAIVAAVSPSRGDRAEARSAVDTAFREIYVATPAEICEQRDPKGHYAKARAGDLPGFTGIANDYQAPETVELRIDTSTVDVGRAIDGIEDMLRQTQVLDDGAADLAAFEAV
jgi:bifunctional enzyme CysN/CysC